jgi:ABC-type Fe3+/spermidine/putrescine transport system ATPase subunit
MGERLLLDSVGKAFGSTTAVADVTLAIMPGEFVTLVGASGCGKTTLLRIAAGFCSPDKGRVLIDGADVTGAPPSARGMGFVFQSYALFPTKTAAQNIGFGLAVAGMPRRQIADRVREVAALVSLDRLLDRYPHELSGGQQQRVALARAIAAEPRLLLLDEPLAALDAAIRARLRDEIRALTDRLGITTLYVTHDQQDALAISDRVVVIRDGQIEQVGTPAEIYLHPANRFVAEFIGTATLLAGHVEGGVPLAEGIAWPTNAVTLRDGPCIVVVRPEELVLADDGSRLVGQVETVRFLGPTQRVSLRLASGQVLTVDLPARVATLRRGDTISVAPAATPALLPS